ncbi:hypothetical protein AArcSl_3069 [Halalkaliarchaeum desulfuricum]|uniref:DUF7845 domain-containing protein n=1 Tax=Halalkaliarchaeum desulfuricum TaxID=2055893 RepID=A0A343TNK4_9EURY|nr:hypothetical protein AArcSl_3069 [Halalkaliarchaeum desulfuricum]
MTVDEFVHCAPHEGDLHLIFRGHGLDPYFAMDRIRKDHDGWTTEGKPTATCEFDGDTWALCYDYDTDNPLDPWENPDYTLETVPEFRFYFVAKDELYEGERADMSKRVRGGTITVRPRWPGMTADGDPVRGVPNLGGPYIDVQVQASNIDHDRYLSLAQHVIGAFGVNTKYLQEPHQVSNWNDAAVYVRLHRSQSGPLYAADGPLARIHQLLEGDREGYRKHVEDHRKLPGYYVTASVTDDRARELVPGHTLGKEAKHYYPNEPEQFEPDHPLYHPKLEVSYQTSLTEETVYWSDTEDLIRELEETVLNLLDWAELSVRGGDPFVPDEYFTGADGDRRTRKLVDCPLPEIADAQEAAVMQLWGGAMESDRAVIDYLLSDGGTVSPEEAAEETGYSYRTIRKVVDRCESVINHTYGELELASKHQQQLLLKRVRAAEENFKSTIEDAAMTVAEAAADRARSAWSKVRQRYNISVKKNPADCRKLLDVGYRPESPTEARKVIREIKLAYLRTHDDRSDTYGVHALLELAGGPVKRYKNLDVTTNPPGKHSPETREIREKIEQVDWEKHGFTPVDSPG